MGLESRALSIGPSLCEQVEEEYSSQCMRILFGNDKGTKVHSCVDLVQDIPKIPMWKTFLRSQKSHSYLVKPQQRSIPNNILPFRDSLKMGESVVPPPKYLPLTFLPDCVIDQVLAGTFRSVPYTVHSTAVLLLADISGFTAFTETYCQVGMSGIEELMSVLNGYLSALAEGDSFLCQWEEKEDDDMNTIIERAFRCAVGIQSSLKPKSDHRGVNIRVKIGIAFGGITTWFIGSPSELLHFVISGHTLPKVRSAQELCDAGEIVVTSSMWECLKSQNVNVEQYTYTYVGTGYVKITSYENAKDCELKPFGSGRLDKFQKLSKRHIDMSRAFLTPVIRNLKTREQVNYLSEITQVTTVFILLPDINIEDPVDLDVAFDIILGYVKNSGGVLNKVLLFDKGCTFLALFGLPGVKHKDDSVRALTCGKNLILSLKTKNIRANIGISNGFCFCGIVGHPQRQEYTVIGRRVNLAARLVTTYDCEPIVLDAETYYYSRRELGEKCFVELETRHLKGLTDVGTLYTYVIDDDDEKKHEGSATKSLTELRETFGMENERSLLKEALGMMSTSEWSSIAEKGFSPVFSIVGKNGSGKSYLMWYAVDTARTMNYKILACRSNPSQKKIPFLTIAFLIQELIKPKESLSAFDYQQIILQYVNNPQLYLLNHLLKVEFPFPHITVVGDEYRFAQIEQLLRKILLNFCGNSCIVIAIDDANFIDVHSWLFLANIAAEPNVLLLLSLPPRFREPCFPVFELLVKCFSVITLGPLNEELIAPLVCQFWGVTAIHKDILNYLKKHTTRSSAQLEEILLHPAVVQAISLSSLSNIDGNRLMTDFYHVRSIDQSSERTSVDSLKKSKDCQVKVCDIAKGANFEELKVPFRWKDSVKERLNALDIQERLLLKRAAVVGLHFTQSILEDISPDMSPEEVASSINTLIQHHILETGYGQPEDAIGSNMHLSKVTGHAPAHPNAMNEKITKHLRFRSRLIPYCILSYMTRDQLNSMNFEIAFNLETRGMLCLSCKWRRAADDGYKMVRGKSSCQTCLNLMLLPKIDLRECTCLKEKSEKYSFISSCYEKTGLKLTPLYYLVRAAQADIENKSPVKALNFADIALKKFHDLRTISLSSFAGIDRKLNPIVVKASIYRVTGEANLLLGNTYEGASYALKGLDVLQTDIFDFFGAVTELDVLHLSFRYSSKERQELANCIYVACQSYCAARSYTIAYSLAKSYLTMIGEFQASFICKIKGGTMFYECQHKAHPGMIQYNIERELFLTCINRMKMWQSPLRVIEIISIGETYLSLAKVHLNAGRFARVEEIAFEAYKILKYVHDFNMLPTILFILSRSVFLQKRWEKCIEVLNRLKDIAHQSGHNAAYALYCCEVMELLHIRENRATTNDRISQCMDFLSQWAEKCKALVRADIAFYIAAKTALWCLKERSGLITDTELADDLFTQWHNTAESLKSHNFHTYFGFGALLSMLKTELAIYQGSVVLDMQAKNENISSMLKEAKLLRKNIHRHYPVFKKEVKLLIKDVKKAAETS